MGSWCKKNKYPGLPRMSLKFPASEHLITSRFSQQIPHFTCSMKLQHLQLLTTEPWLILPASVCLLSLLGSGFELVRIHVWEILWRRSIPLRLAEYDQHGKLWPSCVLRLLRKFDKPQLRMFLRCTISGILSCKMASKGHIFIKNILVLLRIYWFDCVTARDIVSFLHVFLVQLITTIYQSW